MNAPARIVVTALFAVCLLAVAAPAVAQWPPDETAGFYVENPLRVGRTVLDPGTYVVRAVRANASQHLLVVMDEDKTTVFAAVLATPHQVAESQIRTVSRLLFQYDQRGKANVLRSYMIANTAFGYDIVSPTTEPKPETTAARYGTIYAKTASR